MRRITRQIVWLFVVFVIYFGYSAFVDGVALYHLKTGMTIYNGGDFVGKFSSGLLMGSSGWTQTKIFFQNNQFWLPPNFYAILDNGQMVSGSIHSYVGGFMAPDSLLYTILTPFKLVLVGALFASLIPLIKSIFFGVWIGMRTYLKNRRPNILFNYEKAINYSEELRTKLEIGDYEQIKNHYGAFAALEFQPIFMKTMMEEIADYLIRERSTKIFINPCQSVINSLEEMYAQERQTAKDGRPVEWFFDLRISYNYTSIGSTYNIAYFRAFSASHRTPIYLAWKLFSLSMYRFFVCMLAAIIPTIILNLVILPVVAKASGGRTTSFTAPSTIILSFLIISIIFHASFTFAKKEYRDVPYIWFPALIYYFLIIWFGISLALGVNGVQSVGSIQVPGTAIALMWPFFAALGYAVLSSCLILYIISSLLDGFARPEGLRQKDVVNGMVLPAIAWIAATAINYNGILGTKNMSLYSGIAFAIVAAFWVYLTVAGILANNLIHPSRSDPFSHRSGHSKNRIFS